MRSLRRIIEISVLSGGLHGRREEEKERRGTGSPAQHRTGHPRPLTTVALDQSPSEVGTRYSDIPEA